MSLSKSSQQKIAALQAKILRIAGEVQIAELVLSLSQDERWVNLRSRLNDRLETILNGLTSNDIEDRERAFLCGCAREIRLIMASPETLRTGPRSIDSMKATARTLQEQIQKVKDTDQIWGQDPDL